MGHCRFNEAFFVIQRRQIVIRGLDGRWGLYPYLDLDFVTNEVNLFLGQLENRKP